MSKGNYSLNIDNLLEYLKYGGKEGKWLHNWLGLQDKQAQTISQEAYNIVWDEIEENEEGFDTVETINKLFRAAKEKQYSDTELTYFLYWGFSEIDSFANPTIEVSFEPEQPDERDISLN